MAFDPALGIEKDPEGDGEGHPMVALGEPVGGTMHRRELYVATPDVLRHQGIDPATVAEDTDVLAAARDHLWPNDDRAPTGGLQVVPPDGDDFEPNVLTIDVPGHTQSPISLITPATMVRLGWESAPAGWLVDAGRPLTGAEVDRAQDLAGATGLSLSARDDKASLAMLRSGATAAGVLVALCILAMTVVLMRGEAAGEMRTLTATGAGSLTRRAITGVTAGGLALLGVGLSIVAAYLALGAGYADDLDRLQRVPVAHLVVITVGVPTAATISGWLVSGRQPHTLAHQRTEG
jgi:putative ABC transport system permease protein